MVRSNKIFDLIKHSKWLCLLALAFCVCTDAPEYCGPGRQLNAHTEFCFGGEVHQKCGGSSYDPPTQFCHRNTVYTQCNARLYDPDREFCAEDRVYAKCEGHEHAYNPQTHGCVNDLLKSRCGRNFFDPEIEFCAEDDNRIYNLCNGQAFDPTQGCGGDVVQPKCGENNFDPADVFCSGNVIYDFCGGKDYDPVTQKCVDNEVIIIDNGGDDPVPITHTLTINVFPSGSGTVSRDPTNAVYADSSNVKITANAANGYRFVNWSGAGVTDIDSVTATVFMTANRTLTANFELIPDDPPDSVTHTLTINVSPAGSGTVSRDPTSAVYADSSNIKITANAANGYRFVNWSGAGVTDIDSVTATVFMTASRTLTANFELIPDDPPDSLMLTLTINVIPISGGTVTPMAGQQSVAAGRPIDIVATINSGYRFVNWTMGTAGNVAVFGNADSARTTVTLSANAIIRANFVKFEPFNPEINYGSLTDSRDNQVYRTVTIGNQTWMAENLNFHGSGSTMLGRCYADIRENCVKYGRLYNWETVMNGETSSSSNPSYVSGICPAGWHVPSEAEWQELADFVDPTTMESGTKLKSATEWNGTDEFGFSALPGGRGPHFIDGTGRWWSATEWVNNPGFATHFVMGLQGVVTRSFNSDMKDIMFSLRCVRD